MPRPADSPDVAASKTLSYILRHGAEKEGLHIRSDGLVRLDDVIARPKLKNLKIDTEAVFRLVDENAKKRFELVFGYDPSAPKPKKKHVQPARKKRPPPPGYGPKATPDSGTPDSGSATPVDDVTVGVSEEKKEEEEWTERAFVNLPPPESSFDCPEGGGVADSDTGHTGHWYIRAVQGHSIKLEGTGHLESLRADVEGKERAGAMVHGTRWELWEALMDKGLSRMNRQHVHLAPALTGPITPRNNSTLLIFLDLPKLLASNIPVYAAANGVILTPGDEHGVVHKEFWRKAVHVSKGTRRVVWENGVAADRIEGEDEEA
ncbi:hypothetical protein CcaverHIS002_0700100 [Cutaneotrichosporon cavernicola]|uniref:2'-phosphotransferase n=1 Tax=Cutaneotrichosporon cavernicola TaxID=279322 RepID=A0AA48L9Q3_9TREE|nr:uncharacterized protein CcaverHIS019_0700100 [Cutaneotrichosporon cavernicola]BEI86664.1 hypothetical protein CcaverHIS002_0700100 [Cutaneotrichosporon cavernicola]BEI94438.1 hypothetical protein CcaverHIS019_0700100 [Cutaneotrichosporon cavernicola]BEJ02215.1 hypothetical protein CcaverHIS631_0700100 [Cutaneotrichosporon cavernicola]BEJ09975.1 hypothetical protein CcaverHIS641_0700100 [Cutaneotrichosporon cavernicola]